MANKYCVNCGGSVDGVAFCATCGTPVAPAADSGATSAAAQPQSEQTYASPSATSGKSMQTGRLTFVEAIKSFFANYVNFEGRATPSAYWLAALFILIVGTAAGIVGRPFGDSNGNNPISSLVSLAFLLPQLSVGVRRLHDTGRSGHYLWWALLPIVGWILVIVALAGKSENADNKYGPRP